MSILKIKNLTKRFGGLMVLDGCSLDIQKGNITAIIGPNGSGKTTLFDCISNLLPIDKGSILFKDNDTSKIEDFEVAKRGVSRTFQEVRLFKNLNIKDHLEIALNEHDEHLIKSIFGKRENMDERIKEILDLIGLNKDWKTYANNLSYGQRKLLDLAMRIAKKHDVLMLDEPVAGINPKLRGDIKRILIELRKKGETIIVIEHDMNFVMGIADKIYVLDYGKVIAQGKPEDIQNNKKVFEAYLGE